MTTSITIKPGRVAKGDRGRMLLGGTTYQVRDALAEDMVNRGLADRNTEKPVTRFAASPIDVAGFKVGVLGASTGIRNFCIYSVQQGNYVRKDGLVTCYVSSVGVPLNWLADHTIRLSAENDPQLEGSFPILSAAVNDANGATLQWLDDRADSTRASTIAYVSDMHAYSATGPWLQSMNIVLGGRCDFYVAATGSTNILQWDEARLEQLIKDAPFDAIVLEGLLGNTVLQINNGQPTAQTFAQVRDSLRWLFRYLLKFCRVLIVGTLPGNRNVPPTSAGFTTAALVMRWLYTEAVAEFRNILISPQGELLATNYQDPSQPVNSDVMNNLPPQSWMFDDGTHFCWPAQQRIGVANGIMLLNRLQPQAAELGGMAITRAENNVAELGGRYNSVVGSGRFGSANFKGSPDAGTTGNQPTFTTVTGSSLPAGITIVHSVKPNIEGGYDWIVTSTDSVGSSNGTVLQMADLYLGDGSLLTILNDPRNAGKRLRGVLPMGFNWTTENAVTSLEIEVVATLGGVEYSIGAALCARGLFKQGGNGRQRASVGVVVSAGTGYAVGNVLSLVGGTGAQVAKLLVTNVNGSGGVTRFFITQVGDYTAVPGNPIAVTGGSGSGATFGMSWNSQYAACDWGISGNFTLPKDVTVPTVQGFTAAAVRATVTGVPNLGFGVLTMRFGAGALFEVVGV